MPSAATGGPGRPYVPAEAVGGYAWQWDDQAEAYRPIGVTSSVIVTYASGGWIAVRETADGEVPLVERAYGGGFYGPDGAMHEAASFLGVCETCDGTEVVDTAHPSGDPQRSFDGPCPDCTVPPEVSR